jgi:hypothetical protein
VAGTTSGPPGIDESAPPVVRRIHEADETAGGSGSRALNADDAARSGR